MPPILSLVVSTCGRANPFGQLFASLEAQTFQQFEVVIVDQNADGRAGEPEREGWSFPIRRLRTPGERGLSRGRNAGLASATGGVLLFPDDDCWYPPHFLAAALEGMEARDADVLLGRASDPVTGRSINGRFEPAATQVTRHNVWTTGIEWVAFFKRPVLDRIGGYDTEIGIGAQSPWQSCEGQDAVLRALAAGFRCWFDPAVFGHHAELDIRSPAMLSKGRAYARGFGYVLRRHRFSTADAVRWVARPLARAAQAFVYRDRLSIAYYCNVALGRWEGWRMRTFV